MPSKLRSYEQLNISEFYCMFSFQFSKTSVQIHSSHLSISMCPYRSLKNWNPQCAFIILSSCENWVSQMWKILIQLDSSLQYDQFEVQHAYVMIKIKEVMSNWIFLSFTACSHSNFLKLLFRYIHLICTHLLMYNMPI